MTGFHALREVGMGYGKRRRITHCGSFGEKSDLDDLRSMHRYTEHAFVRQANEKVDGLRSKAHVWCRLPWVVRRACMLRLLLSTLCKDLLEAYLSLCFLYFMDKGFSTQKRIAHLVWYVGEQVSLGLLMSISPCCALCSVPHDTVPHRLGGCVAPAVKYQICARHGHAVHVIAEAIKAGAYGSCVMLINAECQERSGALPPLLWPLELQTSRPTEVLFQNVTEDLALFPVGRGWDPRQACSASCGGWLKIMKFCWPVRGFRFSLRISLLSDLATLSLHRSCANLACFW